MDDQTKYKIEKEIKKQKIVRNEFLYHGNSVGKYEFPIIRKQDIDVNKIKLLSYVDTKADDKENKDKTIHFFTHDWKFEKVYENADKELEKLKQYYCLLSPDFSMFTNMPIALQIASVFKNRWCGAYWQSKGLPRGGKKTQPNPYKWCKTTVSKILAQQEYCGDIINFKTCPVT
mgnify:CR=1 FL=1